MCGVASNLLKCIGFILPPVRRAVSRPNINNTHTMTKRVIPLGSVAVTLLALANTAVADIKLHDNLSVAGYVTGSYRYFNEAKTDKFDLDTAKLSFLTSHAPVTGVASIYYTGV